MANDVTAVCNGIIKLINNTKRVIIGLVVLAIAYQVTMMGNAIPVEYGNVWITLAVSVVSFYLGGKTQTNNNKEDA